MKTEVNARIPRPVKPPWAYIEVVMEKPFTVFGKEFSWGTYAGRYLADVLAEYLGLHPKFIRHGRSGSQYTSVHVRIYRGPPTGMETDFFSEVYKKLVALDYSLPLPNFRVSEAVTMKWANVK